MRTLRLLALLVACVSSSDETSLLQTKPGRKSATDVDLLKAQGEAVGKAESPALDKKAAINEFIAMTLFVIIGCGSAMGVASGDEANTSWILQVSLSFGLAITVLASATGGQINCAVTFGLWILGKLSGAQAVANLAAQLLGSILGASILSFVYSVESDKTGGGIGSNGVNEVNDVSKQPAFTQAQALVGEIVMTFLLMHVVCQTAVFASQATATMSIGFAVFLAHSVLIPIDGCSINPTRSFGPALVASARGRKSGTWDHMWVFWLGPLVGAGLCAGLHYC